MGELSGAAHMYLRTGTVIAASASFLGEGEGGSVLNGWIATASEAAAGPAEIGLMLRRAFAASANNAPMPNYRQTPDPPNYVKLLATVGAKTDAQFGKGNRLVLADLSGGRIRLTPMHNVGRKGFDHDPRILDLELDAAGSDNVLGEAVRQAWAVCK